MSEESRLTQRYNVRMSRFKRDGKLSNVIDTFHLMLYDANHPYPDKCTFNTAIDALGKAGNLDGMQGALCDMIEYGFRPDVRTFTSLIHASIKWNATEALREYARLMEIMGVRPNEHTLTAIRCTRPHRCDPEPIFANASTC